MSNPKSVAFRELRSEFSIAAWIAAAFARFGFRRHPLSSTGQPLVQIGRRQLALLDMSFDAIFLVCEQGKVSRTNAVAGEMFGETPKGLEGLSAATFFRMPKTDQDKESRDRGLPRKFDPAGFFRPAKVTALGLDYRNFPVELRSSEILFNGRRHHLLCIRELVVDEKVSSGRVRTA